MITDIMLDIETTGKEKGCKIIQIAAVPFNVSTGEIFRNRSFIKSINRGKQVQYGLTDNIETVNWWRKTNKDLYIKLITSKNGPKTVAKEFKEWFLQLPLSNKTRVWGNSPRFDCIILEGFYEKVLKEKPFWDTFLERDVRTIAQLAPRIKTEMKFVGTKHNAIDDATHQIKYVKEILNTYKLNII